MIIKIVDKKKRSKTCYYKLKLSYMHGDADYYTTETYTFRDTKELEIILPLLEKLTEIEDRFSDYDEFVKNNSAIEEYMVNDDDSGDYYAELQFFKLTYFDESGTEFDTELIFNETNKIN